MLAVYKPRRGERPLDDFPIGTLGNRERAAFLVSDASGWDIAPLTLLRDGPLGPGMVQEWIETDDTRRRARDGHDRRPTAAPRVPASMRSPTTPIARARTCCRSNRATSTASTTASASAATPSCAPCCGRGAAHEIAAGRDGGRRARARRRSTETWARQLAELLSEREISATRRRAQALIDSCAFPEPDPTRPAVPWPPF